jgi:hypothetical protein
VLPNVETKGSSMKYEVKGLTSYGVYDGDRLCGTYESEKAATLVAEALNEEAGRSTVSPFTDDDNMKACAGETEESVYGNGPAQTIIRSYAETLPKAFAFDPSNGHDKETI